MPLDRVSEERLTPRLHPVWKWDGQDDSIRDLRCWGEPRPWISPKQDKGGVPSPLEFN